MGRDSWPETPKEKASRGLKKKPLGVRCGKVWRLGLILSRHAGFGTQPERKRNNKERNATDIAPRATPRGARCISRRRRVPPAWRRAWRSGGVWTARCPRRRRARARARGATHRPTTARTLTWTPRRTSRQDLRGRRTRRCTTALSASPARSLRTTPTRARTSPRWRARRRSTARCVSPRRVRRRRSRSTTAFQRRASASERNTRRPVVSPRFVNAGGRNRALVFSFFLKWFRVIQRDASLPNPHSTHLLTT